MKLAATLPRLLVALWGASFAATALADNAPELTPAGWFAKMNRALVDETYDGIFTYFAGGQQSTLRVVHTVVNGVQRERLTHLDGAPREVVRNGDMVECILPAGDKILELADGIPAGPFARTFRPASTGLSDHYALSLHGTDRVANRRAVRLAITPRDVERYGSRLWIDQQTGLLLRSELVDMQDTKLETFEFVTVKIGGPIDQQDLVPVVDEGALKTHLALDSTGPETAARPRRVSWEPRWVPDGFAMASWDVRNMPGSPKPVDTLMFSDGLATFSVFIEDLPDNAANHLVQRNGATVAVSEIVDGPHNARRLVTVVGEVPVATAQKVARSIHYVSD